jgi:DNA (cytosine-5)-methyltransferase 1
MKKEHKFDYNWTLKDAVFTKDKGKVFSCFACGGGSTMGYKLAGFDVIGHNDIDPKMIEVYKANHNPKFSFHESITTFAKRKDLPKELYELDILDGSPPCSSFSMAGNREKDWGKEKKFREGQEYQVLDTLFFDFIDLAKELQPKVVVAENVKGLLLGNAIRYVTEIYDRFDKAGYYCQHFLLNASKMGVPQRRERVFFICLRKDLAKPFLRQMTLFDTLPYIKMNFKEKEIPFKEIESFNEDPLFKNPAPCHYEYWKKCKPGDNNGMYHPNGSLRDTYKINPEKPLKTITSNPSKGRGGALHYINFRMLTKSEVLKGGSFPLDYQAKDPYYLVGMSVPPIMTAQIASEIYDQWLSKI